MTRQNWMRLSLMAMLLGSGQAIAQEEAVDLDMVNRIIDQATNQSEVVDTLQHMTDVIGPRLTGSPGMEQANQWALSKFAEWGLENGHLESYEFGRGWTYESAKLLMTAPRASELAAYPFSWTPGTDGSVSGEAFRADIETEEDFEKYRGKLAGRIVLLDKARDIGRVPSNNVFVRRDEAGLKNMENFDLTAPSAENGFTEFFKKMTTFLPKLYAFLEEEGALAVLRISVRDAALIEASGYSHQVGKTPTVPMLSVGAEDYSQLVRLMDLGHVVNLELEVKTTFYDDHTSEDSAFAEIPGRGRNPEVVMAGAHFDSWFIGDGAVDNGAGSAVVMEAARILSSLDFEPRRTIRFALWSGEEQGLFGSVQYVMDHYASIPDSTDETLREMADFFSFQQRFPITVKPDHGRISAYFNLDNGSGKIRGIYGEANVALKPVFEAWFKPFHNMGAETVILDRTGGTDHLPFQWVGIPGFQFIQDPLDYGSRLHHTQADVLDHIQPDDLRQASAIMASFLYNAAMRDEMLPRKPLPTESKNAREAREKRQADEAENEADEH